MNRILITLFALVSMGTAANATTLAAGPISGGTTQNLATCFLYNAGDSPVSVSGGQIVEAPGRSVPLEFDSCFTLTAGRTCAIVAHIETGAGYGCKFVISPNSAKVRGALEILATDSRFGEVVLDSVELR